MKCEHDRRVSVADEPNFRVHQHRNLKSMSEPPSFNLIESLSTLPETVIKKHIPRQKKTNRHTIKLLLILTFCVKELHIR